ncbi:MAG: caspase family protein, partial [Spirochaetaceae bacterium]|nr:caspase family protein [Spirochaetaceae bacterium]
MLAYVEAAADPLNVVLCSPDGKAIRTLRGLSSIPNALAFSPDSKRIAAGTMGGQLGIWDSSGQLLKLIQGREQDVNSLSYSRDGRYLVQGGSDGLVRLIRTDDYQSLSLFSDGKDWVGFSDDGYFDASKEGGKLVGVSVGRMGYPIDQFALEYNRPDILLERMGLADSGQIEHYRNQYLKRLRKQNLSESELALDRQLPEAGIVGAERRGRIVDVGLDLADSACDLVSYNVFVNDNPVFGASGKPISGREATLKEEIVLTPGRNKIEVSCTNARGAESFRAATYANFDEAAVGDLYYLGFGVSKYKDASLNLRYADKDAKDLAARFTSMKNGFGSVHARTLVNEEVSVDSIRAAKSFVAAAKPEDTFVLFIAGHGVHDRDKEATYYFLTHETDIGNLAGTAANFELIEDLLQGIAPRSKLFLMDTCESGEAEEGAEAGMAAVAEKRGIQARAARGLAVAKKEQKAQPRTYLAQKDRYIYNDL